MMARKLHIGDAAVDEARLAALCSRYRIRELSFFGSVVRGESRPDSDIRVDFDPSARVGLLQFQSLSDDLESLLGRKVDLVTTVSTFFLGVRKQQSKAVPVMTR